MSRVGAGSSEIDDTTICYCFLPEFSETHHIMDVKWVVNAVADVETQQIASGRLLVQVPLRRLSC